MGFQVAFESENVFAQSNLSRYRVPGGWSSNRKSATAPDGSVWCVCEERRASEYRKSAEPEVVHGSVPARWGTLEWLWSAPCESVQPVYRWPAASLEASVASEAAAWRRFDPGSGRRLWPGCSGRAVACRKSPPVRHSTVHCSSPAWKRRCCMRLSGRRRQSVDCARGASVEVAGLCNVSGVTVEPQVGIKSFCSSGNC